MRRKSWFFSWVLFTFLTFSSKADQPPEILHVSYPESFVINGAGTPEAAISGDVLACDAAGNTYVSGKFSGRANFDGLSITNRGAYGDADAFLAKYDSNHTPIWIKTISGGNSESGKAIAINSAGEIYLAGTTTSAVLSFSGETNLQAQLFLAKYASDGKLLWVQKGSGTWTSTDLINNLGGLDVTALALDRSENPVLLGAAFGKPLLAGQIASTFPVQTWSGGVVLTNQGSITTDIYLAKFSPAGNILWARSYGGSNNDTPGAIAIGPDNDIYVAGTFDTQTTLGASTYTGFNNSALAFRASETGEVKWSASYGKSTDTYPSYGRSIVVDKNNRVTVAIQTGQSPFQLGSFSITNFVAGPAFEPVHMGILVRYLPDGSLAQVVRTPFNASGYGDVKHSLALIVDSSDNLVLRTDSALMTSEFAFGKPGLSLLKYDSSLSPLWTNRISTLTGGSTISQYRSSHAMAFDAKGFLHVAATFKADKGTRLQFGWNNFSPFTAFGDQLVVFGLAPTFAPYAPQFVQQPENLYYQPPNGWTNFAQAQSWPAPLYQWLQNGKPLSGATNQFLTYTATTFTNRGDFQLIASNAYGVSTSIVARVSPALAFDAIPPVNVSVLVGGSVTLGAIVTGLEPISYQWKHANTNLPGATSPNLLISNASNADAGSYVLIASNSVGSITSSPATLLKIAALGAVDGQFSATAAPGGPVVSFVANPDSSFIVADTRNAARVLPGGGIDKTSFTNRFQFTETYGVKVVAADEGGKFLVAGDFYRSFSGQTLTPVPRVARLTASGEIDATFNCGPLGPTNTIDGESFSSVKAAIPLPGGKYLIAGSFNRFNDEALTNVARLNNDGSLDTTFARHSIRYFTNSNPSMGPINTMAVQADGKILLGGTFSAIDGVPYPCLARLNPDGSLDTTFPRPPIPFPSFGTVQTITVLPDQSFMVGGSFTAIDSGARSILRFSREGAHDLSFAGTSTASVNAILQQPDGKYLVGVQNNILRYGTDGVVDTTFKPESTLVARGVYAMQYDRAGFLYIGGAFGLARLLVEAFPEPPQVQPPTVPAAGIQLDDSGAFHFTLCGASGQVVEVETSPDLVHWTPFLTQPLDADCLTVTDSQVRQNPGRFFRVLTPMK